MSGADIAFGRPKTNARSRTVQSRNSRARNSLSFSGERNEKRAEHKSVQKKSALTSGREICEYLRAEQRRGGGRTDGRAGGRRVAPRGQSTRARNVIRRIKKNVSYGFERFQTRKTSFLLFNSLMRSKTHESVISRCAPLLFAGHWLDVRCGGGPDGQPDGRTGGHTHT